MKLLIVDDEQVERDGLEAILRDGYPGLTIRKARNAAKAIETVREFRPDLILMDIKMPGMNGLQAVEIICGDYPDTHFIMVTAYDTFDFARKALQLGVEDYLLKPSKAAEIIETVARVLRQIQQKRSELEERTFEQATLKKVMPVVEADVVTQLLFDHVHDIHLDEMMGLLGGEMTSEAFVILMVMGSFTSSERLYSEIHEKMRELQSGWVGAMSGRQIPIIVFRESGKSYRSQASTLVRQLLTIQERVPGSETFVGIGNPYEGLEQIKLSYQEALISTADTSLPAKHRFYMDMHALNERKNNYPNQQVEKQFVDQIRLGQWDRVRDTVAEIIDWHEKNRESLVHAQQRVMEALWIISRVLLEMGMEADKPLFSFQAHDYRQLKTETESLLSKQIHAVSTHNDRLQPDVVQQIKHYIIEHSQEDISLEMIAKKVDLSPYYISKMFKEQLGINYIDFLTECRIEKAKTLMSHPEMSLKEITFDVGYNDPNYFSKVFKRICGVSPTDYRKTMLAQKYKQ
ncbi:response regulator [Cohnella kolymensis]|nr:response regulator [Cohnella kolymensis]